MIWRFLDDTLTLILRAVSANTGGWICLYECQNTFTLQKLLSTSNYDQGQSCRTIQPIRASLAVRFTCQEISRMVIPYGKTA
jgi:hypothetical protein